MQRDGGNLKTALRRYVPPLVYAVVLFFLLVLSNGPGVAAGAFCSFDLYITVLLAYLLRAADDLSDYAEDERSGKAVFPKKGQFCLFGGLSVACVALIVASGKYLYLLSYFAMLAACLLAAKTGKSWPKFFILPVFLTVVAFAYPLQINFPLIAEIVLTVGISVLYAVMKRRK